MSIMIGKYELTLPGYGGSVLIYLGWFVFALLPIFPVGVGSDMIAGGFILFIILIILNIIKTLKIVFSK